MMSLQWLVPMSDDMKNSMYIDGLAQLEDYNNPSALAMELLQPCTKPTKYSSTPTMISQMVALTYQETSWVFF